MNKDVKSTKTRSYHYVRDIVEDFVNSPYDVIKIKVNMDEWKSPTSCQNSFRNTVKKNKHRIQVFRRKDQIYLSK